MREILLLVTAVWAGSAMANSTPPNPFARPSAGAVSPGAGVVAPSLPQTSRPPVPNDNSMKTPSNLPPGTLPPVPVPPPPVPSMHSGPTRIEEIPVQATYVGKVNGSNVYRTDRGYVFEKASERKVVLKPELSKPSPSVASDTVPPIGTADTKRLPSIVGRPAP